MKRIRPPHWNPSTDRWRLLLAILLGCILVVLFVNSIYSQSTPDAAQNPSVDDNRLTVLENFPLNEADTTGDALSDPDSSDLMQEGQQPGDLLAEGEGSASVGSDQTVGASDSATVQGLAAPRSTVRLFDGEALLGEAVADDEGQWSMQIPELESGSQALQLRTFDEAGNLTETTQAELVDDSGVDPVSEGGDTVPKEVPFAGLAQAPQVSMNSRPPLIGKAPAGSAIEVYMNDEKLGVAQADEQGYWSFVPQSELPQGVHELYIRQVDAAGNLIDSATISLEIAANAIAVEPPTIGDFQNPVAPSFTLQGKAPKGSKVGIIAGRTILGQAKAGGRGIWRFVLPAHMQTGVYFLRAALLNEEGRLVSISRPSLLVIAPAPSELPVTGADIHIFD